MGLFDRQPSPDVVVALTEAHRVSLAAKDETIAALHATIARLTAALATERPAPTLAPVPDPVAKISPRVQAAIHRKGRGLPSEVKRAMSQEAAWMAADGADDDAIIKRVDQGDGADERVLSLVTSL
jgi:hypothetical protein